MSEHFQEHQLLSRPVRHPDIVEERADSGELILSVPLPKTWRTRLLSCMFWVAKPKRLALDALGEEVWKLCDAKRTVQDILDTLQDRHPDEPVMDERLAGFFRVLMERGLLGMAIPKPGEEEPPEGEEDDGEQNTEDNVEENLEENVEENTDDAE